MKGSIEKLWTIQCAVPGCSRSSFVSDYECHQGKAGAATVFRSRKWSTRGGSYVCPTHAILIERGTLIEDYQA